jgi:ankyrin repeat protein
MDYSDTYNKLFETLKNHKYKEFKNILNKVDIEDILFDINIKDSVSNYLLTYAINFNKLDIVKLLIDKGAKIDITDKDEKSILIIPIMNSYIDILELLLKTNQESIGISIIDIKDKSSKIPLHYAIELKNIQIIKLLLEYGSNANTTDKIGNNALHLAIRTRSLEICKIIITYISDVNAKYNTGETALHIACNLQLLDIVNLLIDNKINIDIQDYSHEVTALHYSVILNNVNLVKLLLKNNADPNIQDIFGNTPLHYCIGENNFEIFNLLISSKNIKNIINMNMWNIDGEIPLHMILKQNYENISSYLDAILEKSNLTYQDNTGNTCLHYLIKLDIWKKYETFLINKRLDIFIINSENKMPIDLIKQEDHDKFIDIVIESYINRLKTANELWHDEWENICSKDFNLLDNISIKKLELDKKNKKISKNDQNICKDIVRDKITKLINNVKKNKKLTCYEKSYPVRRSKVCISVIEGSKLEYCTFTGSTLDVLVGIIYLLRKHKNTCASLTKNFAQNRDLCGFYKSIGIMMNTKCEFLNFEIVWVHQKLYLMEGFYDNIKKCLKKQKKFIIIPIGIEMREGSHAGYLIYDIIKKEVERFEPHGATAPPGLNYNPDLLDDILEARFKNIDTDIKYIKPKDYLPKIGFQLMDVNENKNKKIGDPAGFCALWAIWYVDMRLLYSDMDRNELVKSLIKMIRSQNISFRNMIRNYANNIVDIRDKLLQNSKMDINDWLNDQFTDVQINSVLDELTNQVEIIIS